MTERMQRSGTVDFTMMYVAHDAFIRDLHRIASAARAGHPFTQQTRAGWKMLRTQLHVHHTSEDRALWPRLRGLALGPAEMHILEAMEMEHAQVDGHLHRVEGAFADCDAVGLASGLQALTDGLSAHMSHEEDEALALIDRYLGQRGWDQFGREIRRTQGVRAGAVYLPWVLDDTTPEMQAKVLQLLPVPVRVLYRNVWAPRYRRSSWWDGAVRA